MRIYPGRCAIDSCRVNSKSIGRSDYSSNCFSIAVAFGICTVDCSSTAFICLQYQPRLIVTARILPCRLRSLGSAKDPSLQPRGYFYFPLLQMLYNPIQSQNAARHNISNPSWRRYTLPVPESPSPTHPSIQH